MTFALDDFGSQRDCEMVLELEQVDDRKPDCGHFPQPHITLSCVLLFSSQSRGVSVWHFIPAELMSGEGDDKWLMTTLMQTTELDVGQKSEQHEMMDRNKEFKDTM
ncbi:hypothetical protein INR49_001346 [Caranx melampygus]|nr:hypothetical protein INR49_001346 [Caranx melampygus]